MWWPAVAAFAAATVTTWLVLRLSHILGRLDEPRSHSSHQIAMPTAGGLGIIAGFWIGVLASLNAGNQQIIGVTPVITPLLICCGVLLIVLADDVARPLAVWEKAAVQIAVGIVWVLFGTQFGSFQFLLGLNVDLGAFGAVVAVVWIAAICNVYNFMDGIDGISASQGVCMSLFILLLFREVGSGLWIMPLLLACGALGFLVFNLPPGRIFMGDVGSTFLGFLVAVMGIMAQESGVPLWVFSLVLGYYLIDTGYTILRRAGRRENVLHGHRKHLYQRLSKLGWSHGKINLLTLFLSALFGASALAFQYQLQVAGAILVGVAVIAVVAVIFWVEREDPTFE